MVFSSTLEVFYVKFGVYFEIDSLHDNLINYNHWLEHQSTNYLQKVMHKIVVTMKFGINEPSSIAR